MQVAKVGIAGGIKHLKAAAHSRLEGCAEANADGTKLQEEAWGIIGCVL